MAFNKAFYKDIQRYNNINNDSGQISHNVWNNKYNFNNNDNNYQHKFNTNNNNRNWLEPPITAYESLFKSYKIKSLSIKDLSLIDEYRKYLISEGFVKLKDKPTSTIRRY